MRRHRVKDDRLVRLPVGHGTLRYGGVRAGGEYSERFEKVAPSGQHSSQKTSAERSRGRDCDTTASIALHLLRISEECAVRCGDVRAAVCRTQRNFGPKTIQALKKRAGWGGKKGIHVRSRRLGPNSCDIAQQGWCPEAESNLTQEAKSNPTFGAHAAAPLLSDWNRDDSPKIIVATLKEFDTGWKGRTGARQPPTHLGT